jgi:mRNA-degrading endonuclease RelE of RelBE toxin-antitoxin system
LIEKLQDGKIVGDQIKGVHITIFKIRIQNSDIQKGKRSGYRVIYQLQNPNNIILITIYSKLDQGDIYAEQIRRILKEYSAI